MSAHGDHVHIPKPILYAVGLFILVALGIAGFGSLTGIGVSTTEKSTPVVSRNLRFIDLANGSVSVIATPSNQLVAELAPGESGFVRVVMRSLARHRKQLGIGDSEPFKLTRWKNGKLSIEDEITGKMIYLGAFGRPNEKAFARLLDKDLAGRH